MSSPWTKPHSQSVLTGQLYLNAVKETLEFNNTLTEGNAILALASLGHVFVLRALRAGLSQDSICTLLDQLKVRVKEDTFKL